MPLVKTKTGIKRPDKGFHRGEAGQEVCVLGRDRDSFIPDELKEVISVGVVTLLEIALHGPKSVRAETKIRLRFDHTCRFVKAAVMNFRYLCLVVREAY